MSWREFASLAALGALIGWAAAYWEDQARAEGRIVGRVAGYSQGYADGVRYTMLLNGPWVGAAKRLAE